MDLEMAEKAFSNYAKNFNLKDEKIDGKYHHSLRVMELSAKIAEKINSSNEEVYFAKLIGLLHDIARFKQIAEFHTFSDAMSFDHGEMGVQILKENNFIREFVTEDKYDEIIFKAIRNHNKFQIEDGLSEKELFFARIIRDADKLDIYFEAATIFYRGAKDKEQIENGIINSHVFDQIINNRVVKREPDFTALDELFSLIAFAFDLNFKPSIKNLAENNYIDKILDRFTFSNKTTKKQVIEVKKTMEEFITRNSF